MLGPPKMQEKKEKRALQTLCKRGLEKKKKNKKKKCQKKENGFYAR
jgi:hypothetical protein